MLHQKILKEETFHLLKELMNDDYLQGFNLVGGTALSLYLGHRQSIDLDLFSKKEFDVASLRRHLVGKYNFKERYTEKQTLKGDINGVFIDCIRYDYPHISPISMLDNIRITSIPDLLAMKIAAITDSGEREKDFVDVACFSTRVSLNDMLRFYSSKYHGVSTIMPMKALLYFDDIKRNEPLILTVGTYKWTLIENRLKEMVNNPDKIFEDLPVKVNPKIEKLEKDTVCYAREYITKERLHKGFPWLRDSFNDLCGEILADNDVDKKFYNLLRQGTAQRIIEKCSNHLNETQIEQLSKELGELAKMENIREKSNGGKL